MKAYVLNNFRLLEILDRTKICRELVIKLSFYTNKSFFAHKENPYIIKNWSLMSLPMDLTQLFSWPLTTSRSFL